MRFEVLGPLRVIGDTGPVPLRSGKRRVLLAVLLSRPGRPVPAAELAEVMWGGPSGGENLRWHVHHLRRVLDDPERLTRHVNGYALRVGDGELDADEFTDLWERARLTGDAAEARDLLDRALGLWRGDAYGDLADLPAVRAVARGLDERRLTALERRGQADLDLGRHADAVAELSRLVTRFPLRERFRAQLMLALYRSGRQAEALAAYRDARRTLVDELGLEPGPELRALEKAILTGDVPAPSGRPAGGPRPAELPADIATFTGRGELVAAVSANLTAGGAVSPAVVAIAGMGGAGKSALAVHVAHRVAGFFPDGQLYVNLQGSTPAAKPLTAAEVLGRFLRSLGSGAPPGSPDAGELAARYRTAVSGKRLLIVLDNAHDDAQVRPLIPAAPGCAVLITSRRTLSTLDGAAHVELGVLDEDEALALMAASVGADRVAAEADAAARVVRLCGALPLAVCLAASRLVARPMWAIEAIAARLAAEDGRLAELGTGEREVRASCAVGYRDLLDDEDGIAAARLFRLLGLLDGADLGRPVAAALAGLSEEDTEPLLDALVGARLVENHRPGRYRMHDLLRLFARERAQEEDTEKERTAAVRRAVHCYLATIRTVLGIHYPSIRWRVEIPPLRLAHPGVALTGAGRATAWVTAELANLMAATAQTARCPGDGPATAVALSIALVPGLGVLGFWRESLVLAEIAARAAEHTSDERHLAYALRDLGDVQKAVGLVRESLVTLDAARERCRAVGDAHREASVVCLIGDAHRRLGDLDRAVAYLREGLGLSRTSGAPDVEVGALVQLGFAYSQGGRDEEAADAHGAAAELAERSGNLVHYAAALGNRGFALRRAGRAEEARESYEHAMAVDVRAEQTETLLGLSHVWGLANTLYDLGERAAAREQWDRAAEALHGLGLIDDAQRAAIAAAERPETPPMLGL